MVPERLVTVIVAAYNAENTIDETLHSIRAQTYRSLEILVINDGSSDDTSKRVDEHVKADARVRLICQENEGVAAARNRGIAEARGEYIAPIDADDIWGPTKIDKQMKVLRKRGPKVGLVYTWHAVIDRNARITPVVHQPDYEGNVLLRMCFGNLIGNGSAALMRKEAVTKCGGYDVSLRSKSAQGCEDWKLYLRIAEGHEFAVIREPLTFYRIMGGNMTSDTRQMLRSRDLVASEFCAAHPEYAGQFFEGRKWYLKWLIRTALLNKNLLSTAILGGTLIRYDYHFALRVLLKPIFYPLGFFRKAHTGGPGSAKSPLNRSNVTAL